MNFDNKKTEKIGSAIYLLTSFFDDKEPMKWRLRELTHKLLAQEEKGNIVLEISSLLNVAKNVGLVSMANFEIMNREVLSLTAPSHNISEMLKSVSVPEVPIYVASSLPTIPKTESKPIIKDRKETQPEGIVAVKKNGRQDTILSLVKRKKEIMIKDVAPLIDGVSEKTIQRELLAMVSSGILKKEGEKRWSRYSLAE